jgi:uncharacterized protein YjbJ (UPF0337 family)
MGSKTDKINGRIKETMGALTDNDNLKRHGPRNQEVWEMQETAERAAAEMQGKVKRAVAETQEQVERMVEKMQDA